MRPIRNIEDIGNLKTDEKLIECLNGEVNYYRFCACIRETMNT